MNDRLHILAFAALTCVWLAAAPARAQSSPDAGVDGAAADAGLSDQDLRDIQGALDAQAQAQAKQGPAQAASPEPTANPGRFANPQSLNPDLSFITDVAAGWFRGGHPQMPGGHDPAKTGFTLQQVELAANKAVDPYFRFDGALVFHQDGVEVEEAYATTLALPANLQLRAGKFLTRFGRINATHPHTWDFVDQTFAVTRIFGGDGNRGLGAELNWLAPLPWYAEVVASVTDGEGESTARSFIGPGAVDIASPLDFETLLAFKQFFPLGDDWSLMAGLSGATGRNPTAVAMRTGVYGLDLYLRYRPISEASYTLVTWQSELFLRHRRTPAAPLQDWNAYSQLLWRFAQRWGVSARYEWGQAARTPGGALAGTLDYLDPTWTRARQRVSAAMTFWPTEFSRLRLQGEVDSGGMLSRPVPAVLLAFEVSVGAHGAHPF